MLDWFTVVIETLIVVLGAFVGPVRVVVLDHAAPVLPRPEKRAAAG